MKIVFDTSVLYAAFTARSGLCAQLLEICLARQTRGGRIATPGGGAKVAKTGKRRPPRVYSAHLMANAKIPFRKAHLMANAKIPFRKAEEIEAEAEKLLKEHGQFRAPVDPIRLANALGMRVFNAAFEDDSISGILAKRGPNITMLINTNDSGYRKRFTIAHELGHRVLKHFDEEVEHTDHKTDLYRGTPEADTDGSPREEVQANMFAAALLMPAELVKKEFEKSQDVDVLARRFQVSADAMGNRLNALKLL